jgi:hypothetical protein
MCTDQALHQMADKDSIITDAGLPTPLIIADAALAV